MSDEDEYEDEYENDDTYDEICVDCGLDFDTDDLDSCTNCGDYVCQSCIKKSGLPIITCRRCLKRVFSRIPLR